MALRWVIVLHSDGNCAGPQREAAAKLRWFDSADVGSLVEAHAREKTALHDTIAALKQVRLHACVCSRSA